MRNLLAIIVVSLVAASGQASAADGADLSGVVMDNARLGELIRRLDSNMDGRAGGWQFQVEGRVLMVITDERANRMRIMSPVADAEEVTSEELRRLLQANFDSALDARYSVANSRVWSVFLHPLRSLTERDFFSGVAQVVNLVETYGESYSSGAIMFGGGDSSAIVRERYRRIIDRAHAI